MPDENYAREIMQLFSIGLWVLNQDGTHVLDATGSSIPSYTNDDIVSHAKMWTGFVDRGLRGNMEMKRISQSNQLDPLRIEPARRDFTPKMNLYQGHIGDAYPLCADLAPRHFLRAGARYRYLVGTSEASSGARTELIFGRDWSTAAYDNPDMKPLFTPDPTGSALHAALCNADPISGSCRAQSTVTLSVNLPCHGVECEVNDLRLVRIEVGGTYVFYEYVKPACV